ncbi:xylulokinase [Microcella humidisoli]|uniref:FGGY family carbohydrate kinase n=1 Tax=Microcella humidisoli TaxID=2963406 RepID=A0ABY5FZD2_9MICO|nr:FGGY family carbohydrate kinase [Microcella humidisoli]UTT63684.1 FGGY family carbohydrate kinase [Microcella humidisoli]
MDIGTGGVRAVALDPSTGQSVAHATRALETRRTHDGGRTQLLGDWIGSAVHVLGEVAASLEGNCEVVCIALTSAAHNAVISLHGRNDSPPIILWSDARPDAVLRDMPDSLRGEIRERTRVTVDSTWTIVQTRWLAESLGDAWRPDRIDLGHGALLAWMTGQHVTDPSTAAGTGFFDPVSFEWCSDLIAEARLKIDNLPRVAESREVVGTLQEDAARLVGLRPGIPVIVGGTDTACELLAAGVVSSGPVLIKAASSGTAVTVVGSPIDNQRALIYPHVAGGGWYLVAPTSTAWSSVLWMSSILGEDVVELARGSVPGAAGVRFLPHLDGERVPLWRRDVQGSIQGLELHHTRADVARAVLEGMCFSLTDALEYLEIIMGNRTLDVRLSGGGFQRTEVAGILSSSIRRPARIVRTAEPARGAAVLACLSLGADLDEAIGRDVFADIVQPANDLRAARLDYQRRQEEAGALAVHPPSAGAPRSIPATSNMV